MDLSHNQENCGKCSSLRNGLVQSGRLWQTTVEPWMIDTYGLAVVPGLPQLFVLRAKKARRYC